MNRSDDAWPVTVLFAVLLLCLAKVMAAEKPESVAEKRIDSKPSAAASADTCASSLGYVPDFNSKDPLGKDHASESLYKNSGMLVMITVPNLTQYERQKRWEKLVSRHHWPEHGAPQRVLIEDLSQQVAYKDKARSMMRASYKPDGGVIVLIDETGDIRRAFGMMNEETMVLLCDNRGRILHIEADDAEPDETMARRLMMQVTRLADATAKATPAKPTVAAAAAEPTSSLLLTTAPVPK